MANLSAYNVAIALAVAVGGFTYGYGFGVFTSIIGQPGFYAYFNLDRQFFQSSFFNLKLTGLFFLFSNQHIYCQVSNLLRRRLVVHH